MYSSILCPTLIIGGRLDNFAPEQMSEELHKKLPNSTCTIILELLTMKTPKDDSNTKLLYFKKEVEKFVKERNWTKYHTPKNLIQALGIEVSELSEIFLFKDLDIQMIYIYLFNQSCK
ncbi:MAG: hypothetical protein ACTSR5_10065 [Promethearchaeota archaeon]